MDLPVVVMERLPESVVEYYLLKLKNSGYDFTCSDWSFDSFKRNKKAHHRKKKQKKICIETSLDSESNEWEILNKNSTNTSDGSEKSNFVHIMRQSKFHEEQMPMGAKYACGIPSERRVGPIIENISKCGSEGNIAAETELHLMNTFQGVKIPANNSDSNDNFFYNDEWQIISEASCSDVSRSSSPCDDESSYKTAGDMGFSDRQNHSGGLQSEEFSRADEEYKNIVLSECCDVYAFEEDDKLTEPYKSDGEDNVSSPLNLKISDTSEQYSENSCKSQKDEFASYIPSKDSDGVMEKGALSNISQLFNQLPSEIFGDKGLQLTNQKQDGINLPRNTFKMDYHGLNVRQPNGLQVEKHCQISHLLPAGLSVTPVLHAGGEIANENAPSPLNVTAKSDGKAAGDDTTSGVKSNINQYDVVGHILKTMDKSFSMTRRLSIESENDSARSSDNERGAVKSDSSVICSFKQKKARMTMGLGKVLYHRDSSSEDATTFNINSSKQSAVDSKENDTSSDGTDLKSKKASKRKSNMLSSSDIKKLKLYGHKKIRSCWRCGKKYAIESTNNRLCNQCILLDYTKMNNINSKCHSDGECISDKETAAGDQSDHSTVSEPCFSHIKMLDKINQATKESFLPYSSRDPADKANNDPMDLSTNKQDNQDKTTAVPPLKLIVSINQKNLKKSADAGRNKRDFKLKKQRRKIFDMFHKTYKVHSVAPNSERRDNDNLICKILKKRKHKDLLKKRKKSKDNTDYEAVESAHLERNNESMVKRLKISKNATEMSPVEVGAPAENSAPALKDNASQSLEKEKSKKSTCEVINVNRGLFLLSFPEEDELDPNIFSFTEKSEILNGDSELPLKVPPNETSSKDDIDKKAKEEEKPTAAEAQLTPPNNTSEVRTTNTSAEEASHPPERPSEAFGDKLFQLQSDPLDPPKTSSLKNESPALINDKDMAACKSIPKIQSVFSLRDMPMPIDHLQDERHLRHIPAVNVNNCNVYNELDAYATASILELEQSQEHSVILLTSILAREFKELHKINLMEKTSQQFSMDLYKTKMRKVDTIRSLQLACALLTKGQKCKKELSPNMLDMPSEEMSQLLALCNDMYHSKLSEALSKNEGSKTERVDLCKKNGIHADISKQAISIQNTINSLLTPPTVHSVTIIPSTVAYGIRPNFHQNSPNAIPAASNKSDDDVICLGTSNIRNSVIHNSQPKQQEQITLSKISQNKQFSSAGNKDERMGSLTAKQAITLSELAKTNNLQVEATGSAKSSSSKIHTKNSQVTVNIVNNTPIYQKVSFGFNENGNYTSPPNQSSTAAPRGADERKQSPQTQMDKSNWGQSNATEGRNISRIQNQWTPQSLGKQGITITQTSGDRSGGSPAWRNNVPAHNAVPNQPRHIQPNIRPSTLVPIINQFGTLVPRPPLLQGPVHAGRNIASVPMFNIHTQGVIRTWHQPPNAPAQVASHQSSQSPIVCITCRKPISMTCPTGMFCSELCKKTYCAMFPNYR